MFRAQSPSNTALIFEEADTIVDPNDCALIIGVSYFLSSILGLVLKKHVGRRILLLMSELAWRFHRSRWEFISTFSTTSGPQNPPPTPTWTMSGGCRCDSHHFHGLVQRGHGKLDLGGGHEILPVRSRRWTHTLANASSNLWWFVVTKTFKELYTNLGPLSFRSFSTVPSAFFGFVFIYIFLPETHGKTSEETAKSFTGSGRSSRRTGCKAVLFNCAFHLSVCPPHSA